MISHSHHRALTLVYYWSRNCPVESANGSLFSVTAGYGKGGVGPRNTHFDSQKLLPYLSRELKFSINGGS